VSAFAIASKTGRTHPTRRAIVGRQSAMLHQRGPRRWSSCLSPTTPEAVSRFYRSRRMERSRRRRKLVQHAGAGPNAERQSAPHAHSIVADPSNRFALAADLGADRVFVYRLDSAGKSLGHIEAGDAVMRPGSGPRHIAFHPTLPLVFVANELDSTVATLRFDAQRGALSPVEIGSTVPVGGPVRITRPTSMSHRLAKRCTCRTWAQ